MLKLMNAKVETFDLKRCPNVLSVLNNFFCVMARTLAWKMNVAPRRDVEKTGPGKLKSFDETLLKG